MGKRQETRSRRNRSARGIVVFVSHNGNEHGEPRIVRRKEIVILKMDGRSNYIEFVPEGFKLHDSQVACGVTGSFTPSPLANSSYRSYYIPPTLTSPSK
jgi:hypothetical protein